MKSVLISIKPRWCELIASGIKTVEVRKTRPKLETPFKVYIYETMGLYKSSGGYLFNGRGKVIGEFVCSKIDFHSISELVVREDAEYALRGTCITKGDMLDYLHYKKGENIYAQSYFFYGWHISSLVIYDNPRKLSEFKQVRKIRGYHKKDEPKKEGINIQRILHSSRVEVKYFTRPPQSWAYTESEGAE